MSHYNPLWCKNDCYGCAASESWEKKQCCDPRLHCRFSNTAPHQPKHNFHPSDEHCSKKKLLIVSLLLKGGRWFLGTRLCSAALLSSAVLSRQFWFSLVFLLSLPSVSSYFLLESAEAKAKGKVLLRTGEGCQGLHGLPPDERKYVGEAECSLCRDLELRSLRKGTSGRNKLFMLTLIFPFRSFFQKCCSLQIALWTLVHGCLCSGRKRKATDVNVSDNLRVVARLIMNF